MGKILLIEDSYDSQVLVRSALRDVDDLDVAPTLKDARALLEKHSYDLLLIDVALPDGNGFEFCSMLLTEKAEDRPSVLFLTGKQNISDKLMGFSVGADDYMVKPFEPLELKARVRNIVKNRRDTERSSQIYAVGNLRLDVLAFKAEIVTESETKTLNLTPTEFKLLHSLAKQPGQVFSRDQLLYALSGGREHVLDRTIDSHLSRARKKLAGCTHNVESIYGVGYRFAKVS